ncbi:M20/M25/M40 family metallo-hydrolase [Ruminococcus sp. HUN007]|uniref:M20/M25/M40 family metallo-hydrolase n=1 Tax=Ruminococcus sp. HUN007 TaxID=1514668 RepID=UPI0005D1E1F2|nr:M20/M25/M40 family metallo-hydrolase [Ruminococcus sp. HUN007]
MDLENILAELCSVSGVSGSERPVLEKISEIMKKCTGREGIFSGNNLLVGIGERSEGKKHILIDAHADEIGLICSYIDSEGFIVPSNAGGMDYRFLPAQRVTVHGTEDLPGVIATLPPHLSSGEGGMTKIDQVRIDTGYSADELKNKVFPGDPISFTAPFAKLSGDQVTGKALDNRAGVAALVRFAEIIGNEAPGCSITLLFSGSEEIGERGAKTACYLVDPDIAIAVDTSFASSPDDGPKECGETGKGPMIGISPSLSRDLSRELMRTAEENKIPYQSEPMAGLTGTNADQFSVSRAGVVTCTVSVPIRHMHSPAETADLNDIENTALLLAQYVRRFSRNA